MENERASGAPASTGNLARVLPLAARTAWERAFVTFACDEINGLFDRIWEAIAKGDPCPPGLKARLVPFLVALSWDREATLQQAWRIAKRKPDRPEDAFAPAIVLSSLSPDDEEVAAWVSGRPPAVQQALAAARP